MFGHVHAPMTFHIDKIVQGARCWLFKK